MKIHNSGAALSKIVKISEHLRQLERETGLKYLPLNRGVNMVTQIDLNHLIPAIDFNSDAIQVYPPSRGAYKLRRAINEHLFLGKSNLDRILITAGGMNGLDLIFQTLDVERIFLPVYYWGSYAHIMKVRGVESGVYFSLQEIRERMPELIGSAVLICDPGNPLGEKYDDEELFQLLEMLNDCDIPVIFDSPYRRLFTADSDDFYARLTGLPNVVICESFSKSLGLSGQRIGFIHSTDEMLNEELHLRLMYCTNGINGFAQEVVWRLLDTETGQAIAAEFKEKTIGGILRNIEFLQERGILADEFYTESTPRGLFVVLRCTEEELLSHRIGSVSLSFFTKTDKETASRYARICVSYPHDEFVEYFLPLKVR